MENITFEQFNNLKFELYEKNPIIKPKGISTIIADPSVVVPDKSHDNKWHLFCHTWFGVFELTSDDGIHFGKAKKVVGRAMRANINYDGQYYLYYERTDSLIKKALSFLGGKWFSEIYLTVSSDLKKWEKPVKIIGNERGYNFSGKYGAASSNPFLIQIDGKYRLYYSAGLTYINDCGFCEPTHISFAESKAKNKGFVSLEEPIISPDKQSKYLNLCSGCIKVYKLKDCYIALQNGIYKGEDGKSHSAIMLLRSKDGIEFEFVKIFLSPCMCGESNWMSQYVYACDLVFYDNRFWLYFNARDINNTLKGREKIGVYISEFV